ncbi:MAG TPA: hypothetical protein VL022_02260 [Moheibacter sp.]|nr:hypothetical protein [Moheibacter sp.]
MKNPFKNIIENQEVPDLLRDKIMDDIRLIKLSLDLADLVAVKYPSSILDILGSTENKKKDNS